VAVASALVLTTAGAAAASGQDPAQADGSALVRAVEDAVDAVGLPPSAPSFRDAEGLEFDESSLSVVVESHESTIAIGLPAELAGGDVVVESDRVVVANAEGELAAVVDVVGDGSARTMLAAEEGYSDSPVHEYDYELRLPRDAQVVEMPTGGLLVVEPVASLPALEPVDLAKVLPGTEDIDGAELESLNEVAVNDMTAELMAVVPDGMTPLTILATPWAVDANGQQLPTEFVYDDGVLTQVVDTTDAAFPVVSDPLPLVGIALGAAARALAPHVIRAFAATVITRGAAYTVQGGYRTFTAFKNAHGAKSGYNWHHIVEQRTISLRGWDPRAIHNPRNLVQIPAQVHQKCVNSWMARKGVREFGVAASSSQTMRQWVGQQSYSVQHRIGVDLLRRCGVNV
jgi:hypothetical protein